MKYSLRSLMIGVMVLPPLIAFGIPAALWLCRPRAKPAPAPVLITEMEGIIEPGPPEMLELSDGLWEKQPPEDTYDSLAPSGHLLGPPLPIPSESGPRF